MSILSSELRSIGGFGGGISIVRDPGNNPLDFFDRRFGSLEIAHLGPHARRNPSLALSSRSGTEAHAVVVEAGGRCP